MTDVADPYAKFISDQNDPYSMFTRTPNVLPRAIGSIGSDGNQAGEALTLSKKTGISGTVIDADLDGAKQDVQRQQVWESIRGNSVIQQYLEANPLHAKISHDDYEHLDKVTQTAKEVTNDSMISRFYKAVTEGIANASGESQSHQELREQFPVLHEALNRFFPIISPDVLEAGAKLPGQAIGAGSALAAQAARELGMSNSDAAKLERDFLVFGQGFMIEGGMGLAGAKPVPKEQATAKAAQTIRPESIEMLKKGESPPPGFDPIVDEVHTKQAELDSVNLDRLINQREKSTTFARSVDAFEDLATKATDEKTIGIPADAIVDLYASEKATSGLDDGLLGWIPDLENKVRSAQLTGGDVEISLGSYAARVDSSVHTKLKDFLRFREDGISVVEGKELKEFNKANEVELEVVNESGEIDIVNESGEKTGTGAFEDYEFTTGDGRTGNATIRFDKTKPNIAFLEDIYEGGVQPEDLKATAEKARGTFGPAIMRNVLREFQKLHPEIDTIKAKRISGARFAGDIVDRNAVEYTDFKLGKTAKETEKKGVVYTRDESKPLSSIKAEGPERIIRAAIKLDNNIYVGDTHIDGVDVAAKILNKTADEIADLVETRGDGAGFLTSHGRYVDRTEASHIAERQGQVKDMPADRSDFVAENIKSGTENPGEILATRDWLDDIKEATKAKEEAVPEGATKSETSEGSYSVPIADKAGESVGKLDFNLERPIDAEKNVHDVVRVTGANIKPETRGQGNGVAAYKKLADWALSQGKELWSDRGTSDEAARVYESLKKQGYTVVKDEDPGVSSAKYKVTVKPPEPLEVPLSELKTLAEQNGMEFPFSDKQLNDLVRGKFEQTDIATASDLKKFQRDVASAGRQVEQALLKGKTDEALKWKQRQVLASKFAKEAEKFQKEKVRVEKNIDSIMNDKEVGSVEQEHVEQARAMLQGIGFTGEQPVKNNLISREQFVANSNGQIAVAPWMVDPTARAFKGPEDISVADFRDLGKSLKSILHAGREATKLENVHGKADLQNVIFDVKKQLDRFDLIEQPNNPSIPQRAKSLGRWVNAWSLLVERMLDYTDKFDPSGPLTSYLDRPLRDSNTKEIKLTESTTRKLRALQKYTDNSLMDVIPNSTIPRALNASGFADLTRRNLRQLMGYMGSESGIAKVTRGFKVGEDAVWKLIHDNASEADWKWVSGMHELFADLWKESAEMQERDTGVSADPIEAREMVSKKFGKFPGGYWPVKYDRKASNIEGHIAAKNPLFDEHYIKATTPQAYTLTRTQFNAPLDLTGQLIGTHIQGMVHDIAFREAVRNAGKLINNDEFMQSMTQKWGKEYSGLLHGWLEDIANSHNIDDTYARGAAQWSAIMRQNITNALIFLNPGTAMKHGLTALSMSVAGVGPKGFGAAAIDLGVRGMVASAKDIVKASREPRPSPEFVDAMKMVTDPSPRGDDVRQFILDSSAVMRNRNRTAQDTIRASFEKSNTDPRLQMFSDARQISFQIGRSAVSLSDAVSAMPTWYAAYKDAFARTGDHGDAVFEADRAVARAHGSSAVMDKSRIMRTGEAMRWVTPLYNFWNHMQANLLQLSWDMGARAKGREEPGANWNSIIGRSFSYVVIPIIAEEFATAPLDEDHHGFGQKAALAMLRYFGGQYIGVRDITNAIAYGNEPSVGLIGTAFHAMYNAARDARNLASAGKTISKDWMIHTATALGMMTGIGGTQVGKTGSFAKDLAKGTEKNLDFAQFRQGLRTGHSKQRIHK